MAPRNGTPLEWSPLGCVDSADGTNSPKGSMSFLTNLVPSPTTKNCFVCRPASAKLTSFSGFSTPTFLSALFVLNGVAYGMIASALHSGKDQPYAYNLLTNTFISISGISSSNVPTSPPTTGAWTPPSMDLVGTDILVAHAGFPGTSSHFFGVIDISTPSSPAWSAINTTTNSLPGVPTVVKNFNQRAYFAVGNQGWYSDVLAPTVMTNAGQALTLGDNTPIVAFCPLPINTTSGGVAQGLIAFKNTTLFQITGDAATMDLADNEIPGGVGTYAPLSVVNTPVGIAFIAPDGLRLVTPMANITEPIGDAGQGITYPFIGTLAPSRICSAFNEDTLRVSVQNNVADGNPTQEWWYDLSRKIWTGPHTFPAGLIQPYKTTFIMAASGINAALWQSDPVPSANSVYIENAVQLTFIFGTTLLPVTGKMFDNSLKFTTIAVASQASAGTISVIALDEQQSVLSQANIMLNSIPTLWNNFTWGVGLWLGQIFKLAQIQVPWPDNVVFRQMSLNVTGNCFTGLQLSNIFLMYQPLGALASNG